MCVAKTWQCPAINNFNSTQRRHPGVVQLEIRGPIHFCSLAAARVFFRSRRDIALEILALRHQVAVLKRKRPRPQLSPSERVRAGLSRAKLEGTKSGKPIGRPPVVFRRDQARALREQGYSWGQIARQMSVSKTSVRRACQSSSE